ncbi:MAG: DUF4412 domain-containing protein [Fibrobacteres bacterium]|jgi:hypothetical protein|nr:DUF4412 domain-containing protein [Fibrobacterota bacterium]
MKRSTPLASGTLFCALMICAAHAGVTITQLMKQLDGDKPPMTNLIHLEGDKARIDMGQNPSNYVVYRGDKNAFWMIDTQKKTCTVMTEKDLEAMHAKKDAIMAKLREQMKSLPPERQKMMEEMMAKMASGGAQAPRITYRKIGDGGKVEGWSTEKYEGYRDSAKVSELWTAAPKSIGLQEADVKVVTDMAKFFQKFAKGMPDLIGNKENGLEGVPVKSIGYKDGKPTWESDLKSVKKESLDASLFEMPAGFTENKMEKMGKPE